MKGTKRGHKGPRKGKLRTPQPVQDRVVAKKIEGKSDRQIGREEHIKRDTVKRILSQSEVRERLLQYRQEIFSRIPKALEVYDYHLEQNNERVATKILEGTQALIKKQAVIVEEEEQFGADRSEKELRFFARNGFWPDDPEAKASRA